VRILHLLNTVDPAFGGPVEAARQSALGAPEGVSVEVLSLDRDVSQWAHSWPVRITTVGASYTRYRYSPGLVPWLRANSRRFDAVVVHGVWHYQVVAAWQGLRDSGVPYFVIPHGMLHTWFKQTHPLKHVKKAAFWHTVVHKALQGAAAVLFLCDEERRLSPLTFPMRLKADAIVPIGVQAPVFGDSSPGELLFTRFPILRGKRLLLFLGRICRMKACDDLLHAFAGMCDLQPNLNLVMCGPDFEGWQNQLVALAERLGIAERVTWTGPLYSETKWDALHAAELFILPSHCETFPVSVLEALACSTPVLISDKVGIHREIRESGAGLVCGDNPESIGAALRSWLTVTSEQRTAYRSAAYKCFEDRYEFRAAVHRQLTVIRDFAGLAAESDARSLVNDVA
jgi:glycosyltransferase involved in cell wall biosynthesis